MGHTSHISNKKMKVTYTAIDGKTFEAEDECLAHEDFLAQRPQLVRDAILNALHASRAEECDGRDNEKLDRLIGVIEQFAEVIGFDKIEGISEELKWVLHNCAEAYNRLETVRDAKEMRERVGDQFGWFFVPDN